MATTGMSCIAIVACLMLHFAAQSIDAVDFNFDFNSCDSLLPNTDALTQGRQNVPNKESLPDDVFPKTDRKSPQNGQQSLLVASHEEPPYNISVSRQGSDDLFTGEPSGGPHKQEFFKDEYLCVPVDQLTLKSASVTLDGGEFNGFIIQARDLRSSKGLSEVSGSFIDPPPGVKILECGTGGSFSSDNTAISTETSLKKSVKLTWKSQTGHVKNMVFVATVVKNNTYWPNVKSNLLKFTDSPDESSEQLPVAGFLQGFAEPNLDNCGKTANCYRYSGTSSVCKGRDCNFVFVSEVSAGDVIFTLGGRFEGEKGYIGVAFTNIVFGKLELYACMKELKDLANVKLYVAKDIESQPEEKFQVLQSKATSFDHGGSQVWCRFQRALQIPGSSSVEGPQLSDFTQPQTMMFLRGSLTRTSVGVTIPQLGKSAVFAEHQWNRTAVVDTLVTVDGVSRGEPLIGLILVSIVVTLFHAATN